MKAHILYIQWQSQAVMDIWKMTQYKSGIFQKQKVFEDLRFFIYPQLSHLPHFPLGSLIQNTECTGPHSLAITSTKNVLFCLNTLV